MKTRSWLFLTAGTAALQMSLAQVTFTPVTTGDIVHDGGGSFGCAWGDYDGDGYLDLFVTNDNGVNFLYHNNGDGTFTRIKTGPFAADTGQWRGCAWGDFDNDGKLDLIAVRADEGVLQTVVYQNTGGGTFTRLPASALGGVSATAGGFGPVWGDFDRDGFIDLFVARFGANWLLKNAGDGTFARVGAGIPPSDTADHATASWIDSNGDGWPDLFYVTSSGGQNRLFLGQGGTNFVPAVANDLAGATPSFGFAWGDYDNDGLPDLFIVNAVSTPGAHNWLFHNNGDGSFTAMESSRVGSIVNDGAAFDQCAWGDYDNDGYLDLFVTSTVGLDGANPVGNRLYHNNGDGSFTSVEGVSPVLDVGNAVGCAWGDYDNDGFLDLFVARGGIVRSENNSLYHNNGNANGWLKVKCIGTVSNRSAIGAKIKVRATIGGKTFWQLREISGGTGIQQNALEAHFGLGDAAQVDTIRIEWPSGIMQEFHDVPGKKTMSITEPARLGFAFENGSSQLLIQGGRGFNYEIQRSTDLKTWAAERQITIDQPSGIATIPVSVTSSGSAFYRAVLR